MTSEPAFGPRDPYDEMGGAGTLGRKTLAVSPVRRARTNRPTACAKGETSKTLYEGRVALAFNIVDQGRADVSMSRCVRRPAANEQGAGQPTPVAPAVIC